ncbi:MULTISPECIES: phenolic acid decarboxylase [Methylotenera]|uniref:phenolic acid decarboxylase n=1 Tax=Methylotenera TaxID=359407 RepID=UPI000374A66F|nr:MULTISPECIES: phenolic acid decarboxylase [Methylotenera]
MLKIKLFAAAFAMCCISINAFAVEAYIGQFLYQYNSGNTYRVIAKDNEHMAWECIKGPEVGTKGLEKPQRYELNKHIYYVTWVEKTGVQVSQAVNFRQMKVYSTIIEGKNRYVLEGTIVREK